MPCVRYKVRVPAEVDTKTFADVGDLLTTSVSAGLSKGSDSIHLIYTIQRKYETGSKKIFKIWEKII